MQALCRAFASNCRRQLYQARVPFALPSMLSRRSIALTTFAGLCASTGGGMNASPIVRAERVRGMTMTGTTNPRNPNG